MIIEPYKPGDIGRLIATQAEYYFHNWQLRGTFEGNLAIEIGQFIRNMNPERDRMWVARCGADFAGAISIDGSGGSIVQETLEAKHSRDLEAGGARLRWFFVTPEQQGKGVGRRLLDEALRFCEQIGFPYVYLWTMTGLDAARHLYESVGFRLVSEQDDHDWGRPVRHQLFLLNYPLRPSSTPRI